MNHLMKKCPVITLEDRRRVIMQFHDLPTDLSDSFLTADNGGQNGTSNGKTVDLPFAPKPDKSALDTLAEVSYRMSDKGQSDSGKPRRRRKSSTRDAGGTHGLSAEEVFMSDEKLPGQEGSGGQNCNREMLCSCMPAATDIGGSDRSCRSAIRPVLPRWTSDAQLSVHSCPEFTS